MAGGVISGKVKLRIYFLSSNFKHKKKKSVDQEKIEEKNISGETVTNSYKTSQR